jgi:hypothetical protein
MTARPSLRTARTVVLRMGSKGIFRFSLFVTGHLSRPSVISSRQNTKEKTNHESTKLGKHEKGPIVLYNPTPLSCFRDSRLVLWFFLFYHSSNIPVFHYSAFLFSAVLCILV